MVETKKTKDVDDIVGDLLSEFPTEVKTSIELPSGRSISIKPITFEEEKMLLMASKGKEEPVNAVLASCVEGVDIEDLLLVDKNYIIFKLREISFGDLYKFILGCPECGAEQHFSVEISKLPVDYFNPDDFKEITLPLTKLPVKLKLASIADEKYITENKTAILDNLWRFIVSVKGQKRRDVISSLLKKLTAGDINFLIKTITCADFGVSTEVRVVCNKCEADSVINLPINEAFFTVS